MSYHNRSEQDARPPGPALTLSSNNPFRNRAVSPSQPPPRPVSKNPFLDDSSLDSFPAPPPTLGNEGMGLTKNMSASSQKGQASIRNENAAEIFDSLTLEEESASGSGKRPSARSQKGETLPPPYSAEPRRYAAKHRPSHSQEEALRARKAGGASSSTSRQKGELDIFADPSNSPQKSESRRPRRNSESSVMDRKVLDLEDEKKRQERKRRERRHREREGSSSKPKKPNRQLDVIDKLDLTSIYGTGLFHHDGPFDACNPHRNRQGSKRAPMHAFPKDSLNNVLGGGGPINKRPDHAAFLGRNDDEAFKDFSRGGTSYSRYEPYSNGAIRAPKVPTIESATTRDEPIHGEETLGLGTSTFLEGAPAARTAIQRRESDHTPASEGGGISRKKSIAQRIRGINNRRDNGPSGRLTGSENAMNSPDAPVYTPGSRTSENNPFFNEFTSGDDSKKESITIVEPDKRATRARAPSSPRRGSGEPLERRLTSDGNPDVDTSKPAGSGFLSRVKSLKGGSRKNRPERPLPPLQMTDS